MGFFEQVSPGAFDKTLADGHNIFAEYAHDDSKILGSTKTSSLTLSTDNIGLRFSLQINPNVSYANDVYELVKSKEIEGCSFGFTCNQDDWSLGADGVEIRTLLDVNLIEVTITPFPAYADSEAETRCESFENHKALKVKKQQEEIIKRKLEIELELA